LVKAYCEKLSAGARSRDFSSLMELLDDEVELVGDADTRRRGKKELLELLSLLPSDYSIEGEVIGSDGVQIIMDFRSRSASFDAVHRGVQNLRLRHGKIGFIYYRV
jgi:hypothetical protein